MIGQRLNHYEILEELGSGGMGVVYRARDTKLGRDIAIKVLRQRVAWDSERGARFEREARVIAALNHPNIVTVYSIEESEGVRFLTMELVEGEVLSNIVGKKGMPLNRFFDLAISLADALSSAHSQGVTHRDVKPANIMVNKDGRLKVLDFGLAKILSPQTQIGDLTTGSPTTLAETSVTGEGEVIGTVAYMSPEQAEGRSIDHRSDVFSLGVVLYEMTTGLRPFQGDTPASLISSILRDTPPSVCEVNRLMPRHLGRIVARCMAKDVQRRFQTALDVRNELAELKAELDSGELSEAGARAARGPKRAWAVAGAVAATIVLAAAYLLVQSVRTEKPAPAPRLRVTQLTDRVGFQGQPSISPDGGLVAFVDGTDDHADIYLQRVGGERAINLTADSPVSDSSPAFSPDGNHIAFRSERDGGGLFAMGATGESPRRVATEGQSPAWSPDGVELVYCLAMSSNPRFTTENAIRRSNLTTGKTQTVVIGVLGDPAWSPHGHRIAYFAVDGGQRDIWTVRPDGSDPQRVTDDKPTDWRPRWAANGQYLYFVSDRGGADNIWRIPFDEESGRARGEPEPVTSGTSSVMSFDLSADGRRIALAGSAHDARLEFIDFDPVTETLGTSVRPILQSMVATPDLSPDRNRVVFMTILPREDIHVVGMDGTGLRRLTDDEHRDRYPRWSPNGDQIAFFSNRSGKYEIWTIRPDGSGLTQRTNHAEALLGAVWAPDGTKLACGDNEGNNFIARLGDHPATLADSSLRPLSSFDQEGMIFQPSSWSPDGRRLAGSVERIGQHTVNGVATFSLESGKYTVHLTFDNPLSNLLWPEWLPDGERLVYEREDRLFLLDCRSGEEREIQTTPVKPGEWRGFGLSRDGRGFFQMRGTMNVDVWLLDADEDDGY